METSEKLANWIEDCVNVINSPETHFELLLDKFGSLNNMETFFYACIDEWAKLNRNQYDERNMFPVLFSKKIVEHNPEKISTIRATIRKEYKQAAEEFIYKAHRSLQYTLLQALCSGFGDNIDIKWFKSMHFVYNTDYTALVPFK